MIGIFRMNLTFTFLYVSIDIDLQVKNEQIAQIICIYMAFESDKIIFEIYEDKLYNDIYQVVYHTELNEHNKHVEIARAMSGEHFFEGFIKNYKKVKRS
jgi:hypothetical protein